MTKTSLLLTAVAALFSLNSCKTYTPDTTLTNEIKPWSETGDDSKARTTLRNATHKAAIGETKKTHEADLIFALENATNTEVKQFIIHELKFIGGNASIKPLSKYLLHEKLSSHASQALLSINISLNGSGSDFLSGFSVSEALAEALPKAGGKSLIDIVKTIGSIKKADSSTLNLIEAHSKSGDKRLKQTALRALAEIGNEKSAATMLNAISGLKQYERSVMVSYNLHFARNLDSKSGERHALNVMSRVNKLKEDHLFIKCLSTLYDIKGNDFTDDLIDYLGDDNLRIAFATVSLLVNSKDSSIDAKLIEGYQTKGAMFQAQAIKTLVKRKAERASFLIGKSLSSKDQYLRSTAASLAGSAKVEDVIEELLQLVKTGTDEDKKMSVAALSRIPAKDCAGSLIRSYNTADNSAKALILSVMASKRNPAIADLALQATLSSERDIKKAAYAVLKNVSGFSQSPKIIEMMKNSTSSTDLRGLQAALVTASAGNEDKVAGQVIVGIKKGSSAKSNISLIQVLGRIGQSTAFNGLISLYNSGAEAVQKEAIRTLAKWTSIDQFSELLKLSSKTSGSNRILMVRGLSTLIVNGTASSTSKKSMLQKLSALAPNDDEKKKILDLKSKMN